MLARFADAVVITGYIADARNAHCAVGIERSCRAGAGGHRRDIQERIVLRHDDHIIHRRYSRRGRDRRRAGIAQTR